MTTFKSIVQGHANMETELPLIHTSRCEFLPGFTAEHTIEARHCDVFEENLIYLFYGRPAYRSQQGNGYGEAICLCPICFVFKPNTVSQAVHRIFPCDSGAVDDSRFEPEIHASDLDDLELQPTIESAQRLVNLIFSTNRNYFYGQMELQGAFVNGTLIKRYCDLLERPGPVPFDDRKSAIEIQANRAISLRDQLMFVVLPREILEDKNIRETISRIWNCDIIEYPTFNGDAPNSYYAVVRHEVARRLEASGDL